MEPHSIDMAHGWAAPHHDGVFGPLLWVDATSGEVWPDGSGEPGTRIRALLVWVGTLVVSVSEGVKEGEFEQVSQRLRAFLRRADVPLVFTRGWLPEKTGVSVSVDAPQSISREQLARAAAYVLVTANWLERESVAIELEGERFQFEVRESLDEAGRVFVGLK